MKEEELRTHAVCTGCRRKLGETGLPLFWRLKIERFGIKMDAVKRQHGLTMLLGGHAGLAAVMGQNEDMAESVLEEKTITLCEECFQNPVNLFPLI